MPPLFESLPGCTASGHRFYDPPVIDWLTDVPTDKIAAMRAFLDGWYADVPPVEPEELDGYFREIADRVNDCRFGDCTHRSEPGCAVRGAVEQGKIAQSRYQSYLQLRAELEEAYAIH